MVDVAATPTKWHWDPLRFGVELPYSFLSFPLGYPVALSTNSEDVRLAAEESWGGFPQYFSEPPINVRVVMEDEGEPASVFEVRGQQRLLALISDAHNFAFCDPLRHFAWCFVTRATARNRAWFRYFYLDSIINLSLWQTHLTRIHAGCVARSGRGVLLCGASGAGKSCLTYACARRGWTLISDEAPSIVRRCQERIVIGKPQLIHLREGAFSLFPELQGQTAKPDPVGKISFEVRTAKLPNIEIAYRCEIAAIVFLERRPGRPAQLRRLAKEVAWQRFAADLPYFDEPAHGEHEATLRNLLGAEVYELQYGELEPAIEQLERVTGG